jgi:hypothetical protein
MNHSRPSRAASLAVAAALCVLVAACQGSAPAATDSASPTPADARGVLDAYLRALVAGDCQSGRTLWSGGHTTGDGDLCGDATVSVYRIGDAATPTPTETVYATTLTTGGSRDGSVSAGQVTWFYTLDQEPDGRWLIHAGGSGP